MTWLARAFIATGLLLLVACGQAPQPYDVAINNGRLIDPESRLDAVRSVGTRAVKIAAGDAEFVVKGAPFIRTAG